MIVVVGVNYAFVDCETLRPCFSTRLPSIRLLLDFVLRNQLYVCLLRLQDRDMRGKREREREREKKEYVDNWHEMRRCYNC